MGRSLSAVSRGVRLASRRYKYAHLAVRGVYEAEGLADSLEYILANETEEQRYSEGGKEEYPRVGHLYIELDVPAMYDDAVAHGDFNPPISIPNSDIPPPSSPTSPAPPTSHLALWSASRLPVSHPPPSPVRTRGPPKPWEVNCPQHSKKQRPHQIKWASALGTLVRDGIALKEPIEALAARAIARILIASSRTLESLTLIILSPKQTVSFSSLNLRAPLISLPALRELDLVYTRDPSYKFPTRLLASLPLMPALTSLNLSSYDGLCMPHVLLTQIASCAPQVKHLQLPAAGVRDGWIGYLAPPKPARLIMDGESPTEEVEEEPQSPGASRYAYPPSPPPLSVRKIAIPPLEAPRSALDQQFAMSAEDYDALAKRDGRIEVINEVDDDRVKGEGLERNWLNRVKLGNWWRDNEVLRMSVNEA